MFNKDKSKLICIVYTIVFLILLLLLGGCRSTKYIPITEHHYHDSVRVINKTDSLIIERTNYVKDSMAMEHRGDTVIIRYYHKETEAYNKDRTQRLLDSLFNSNRDTVKIPQPYPVKEKVTFMDKIEGAIYLIIFVIVLSLAVSTFIWRFIKSK